MTTAVPMSPTDQPLALPGAPQPTATRGEFGPALLSICIPAYNRPDALAELLDSVLSQTFESYEVVISEDHSPQREDIRATVARYQARHPGRIWYFENEVNLGYDRNFRRMIRRAAGEYCFIMGNDDIVAPDALATVADALTRSPDVGVVLRSFAFFRDRPENYDTISRYYPDELWCPPGPATVEAFFRRAGIMSGLVLNRAAAIAAETEAYDGTLFYQQHLVAHILMQRPGLFVPEVLAFYRLGGHHEFGTSEVERGRVSPGESTDVMQAVRVFDGMLAIARGVDATYGSNVYERIVADEARHSFPTFAFYADSPRREYWRLYRGLGGLGFSRSPLFHMYAAAVAVFGGERMQRALQAVRRRLGYTPSFGGRPPGAVVLRSPALGNRPYASA